MSEYILILNKGERYFYSAWEQRQQWAMDYGGFHIDLTFYGFFPSKVNLIILRTCTVFDHWIYYSRMEWTQVLSSCIQILYIKKLEKNLHSKWEFHTVFKKKIHISISSLSLLNAQESKFYCKKVKGSRV